jgi:hypothetical protein
MYQDEFSMLSRALFTRGQLHNLLMSFGAPVATLTDELWAELLGLYGLPRALPRLEVEAPASPRAPFQEPLPSPPPYAPRSREPVQGLAEIMAQQAAGIGPGSEPTPVELPVLRVARGPPATATASATASTVQTWMSPKMRDEEERAGRRAAEMEKMDQEKREAYHKRRQKQLEEAGAPQCYNCGWFGHVARVCRNPCQERPQRREPRQQQGGGLTLADFVGGGAL